MTKPVEEPQEDLEDDYFVEPLSLTPKRQKKSTMAKKKKFRILSDDDDDDLIDIPASNSKLAKSSQNARYSFSDSDDGPVDVQTRRGHIKRKSRSRRRSVIRTATGFSDDSSD